MGHPTEKGPIYQGTAWVPKQNGSKEEGLIETETADPSATGLHVVTDSALASMSGLQEQDKAAIPTAIGRVDRKGNEAANCKGGVTHMDMRQVLLA